MSLQDTVVYAGPMIFGPWTEVYNTFGERTYTITVTPSGNVPTIVTGEVRYYSDATHPATDSFVDTSHTFHNGNSINKIEVRLIGNPTGAPCTVSVS